MDSAYKLQASWNPGYSSMELVEAELKRCFSAPEEALEYLYLCEDIWDEAQRLMVALAKRSPDQIENRAL